MLPEFPCSLTEACWSPPLLLFQIYIYIWILYVILLPYLGNEGCALLCVYDLARDALLALSLCVPLPYGSVYYYPRMAYTLLSKVLSYTRGSLLLLLLYYTPLKHSPWGELLEIYDLPCSPPRLRLPGHPGAAGLF